ncbi:Repeat domain-containing protein [Cnuella takakiae]|uniref:Repeat domain-containing protein n=1 Tax=Cnuella takakiae TaxID=1302690 RepID=A0A1M5CQF2_9BACT|nr:VCBS repeat-containing protein [Cnuella takakiae]SHF56886.1 Repeat domain-containing protein [Cnuella takakiae]
MSFVSVTTACGAVGSKFRHASFVQLTLLFLCLQGTARSQGPLFQLLPAAQTGIQFRNDIREDENLNILAYEYFYNGGAVAVGDINNDGLEDLFFTANMKPNKLYLNQGNLQFKDITRQASAALEGRSGGWKTGATMADVNGDGLLDIYLCYSGKVKDDLRRNQLFINKGNSSFEEQAKAFGLDDPGYSTQAAFFDFDNDKDLDLFLLNHNVKKYDNMQLAKFRTETDPLAGNKLFRNDGGRFKDVSQQAGIYQYPLTFGLGIAIADINKDGWQDVYVTNDYNEPDYLYINKGDGSFTEQSGNSFRHLSQFSMGVDIADFNNDALPDIITLDMLPEDNRRQKLLQLQENYEAFELMQSQNLHRQYMRNMLQLNNGDGTFSEIGQLAGVAATDWSWCPLFADFDNDGFKDLFVTTGYLRDYTNKDFLRYWGDYKIKKAIDKEPMLLMDLVKAMPVTPFRNYVYRNNGDLSFANKQQEWGFVQDKFSSGAAYADLDRDGDLDLVINNLNEEAFVYRNGSRETMGASYLSLELKGKGTEPVLGTKVYLYNGGATQYSEVNPVRGYLSTVSLNPFFGLGKTAQVDSLRIVWPDRSVQVLTGVAANQHLVVNYAPAAKEQSQTSIKPLMVRTEPIIKYKHEDFTENDFKRQLLMLWMYSKTGPVMARADVNGDGMEDLFISGDQKGPGKIYLQGKNGFAPLDSLGFGDESASAIAAATFFDANGDGYPDLYLAKGGYSLFEPNTLSLQDELYLNDGKGSFTRSAGALPNMSASSKSVVRACDYDGDGDMDLFVGGRVVPGAYPTAPKSFLLKNNGRGMFLEVKTPFAEAGMITDAQWADLDGDGRKDLVLCGEMMPVKVYGNTAAGFVDQTGKYFDQPESGFWSSLAVEDMDGDGKPEIIAGNLGANTRIRASAKEPAELYYADFDGNGSIDPFFNFYVQGKSYPFVSRDELNEQIYPMRRKFTSYKDYADATMQTIFTKPELDTAKKLTATEIHSVIFHNKGGLFEKTVLPLPAQFATVARILTGDFNKDDKKDLLLLGNQSFNRLKIGSIDANYGCMLQGDGKGGFSYLPQTASGLCIIGDVKSAEVMAVGNRKMLVIGICNDALQTYIMH